MTRPVIHSITWSDEWKEDRVGFIHEGTAPCSPLQLDRELRCWATYPDKGNGRAKRKKKGASRRQKPKLWAVVIIEEVQQVDAFLYEITLRRVFKEGERIVRVQVENDPNDQSDDAKVFSLISPKIEQLDSLEQHLTQMASRRVYYAIAETWSLTVGRPNPKRAQTGEHCRVQ